MAIMTRTRFCFEPLSLQTIDISLTDGTDIPPPFLDDYSPELDPFNPAIAAPRRVGTPPTPNGGPLSSHPTTPSDLALEIPDFSCFHYRPRRPMAAAHSPQSSSSTCRSSTSQGSTSSPHQPKRSESRSSSLRRFPVLRSLSNLYTASTDSLASRSHRSDKRPESSPSVTSTPISGTATPRLNYSKKQSGNWFKRKSGLWGDLNVVCSAEECAIAEGWEDKENLGVGTRRRSVMVMKGAADSERRRPFSSADLMNIAPPVLPSLKVMGVGEDIGDLRAREWLRVIQ